MMNDLHGRMGQSMLDNGPLYNFQSGYEEEISSQMNRFIAPTTAKSFHYAYVGSHIWTGGIDRHTVSERFVKDKIVTTTLPLSNFFPLVLLGMTR